MASVNGSNGIQNGGGNNEAAGPFGIGATPGVFQGEVAGGNPTVSRLCRTCFCLESSTDVLIVPVVSIPLLTETTS